ncbi:MAG: Rrf2 family transcriptional regulator [Janthinobacterium lividum]
MVATRFAVAIHILLLLASGLVARPATSLRMAQSVNTNPVVVRRITGLLARAGLVRVKRGLGGAELMRAPEEVTFGDVWQAVNPGGCRLLLQAHGSPNTACVVGCSIHWVLDEAFAAAEAAMHASLCRTTLASLVGGMLATAGQPAAVGLG